jgi:hypothetical protein
MKTLIRCIRRRRFFSPQHDGEVIRDQILVSHRAVSESSFMVLRNGLREKPEIFNFPFVKAQLK